MLHTLLHLLLQILNYSKLLLLSYVLQQMHSQGLLLVVRRSMLQFHAEIICKKIFIITNHS
ncbi:hypothetical protein V1477_006051 [Vespula maculifrons]|uniref:Uncharacterized protein n=1 Tax=Vespula maculifrons TaxID=7453 RepID=A0ABD2CLP8_VESMC